ncbi:hypothetical protein BD413DRAFT_571948 [Trametes elegans]|nr:hypothetical protein BD413DRAFT_571948 [Trametes elegans]
MDVARARSPPGSLGRRPIGPRSPGKPGSTPKNIIPLDLSAQVASLYSSPEPTASANSRTDSPPLRAFIPSPSPPEAADGHQDRRTPSGASTHYEREEQHTPSSPSGPSCPPTPTSPASPVSPVKHAREEPATAAFPPSSPEPSPPTPRSVGSRPSSGLASAHARHLSEKCVQASAAVAVPSEAGSTPASTRASTPALSRIMPRRPPLAPPPALNFEAEPIPWKGMTLEAAQWSLTSEQLQETVSRAIRHSASESFIRVVPVQTFDVELPEELERLDSLKATTQAQYRFSMHRRTMLLQSLVALSQSQYPDGGDGEALYSLTTQLADLTVSCDRLMETLVRISDQRAQIQQVQNLHIASALAMALRKLNTSYARRTTELHETRAYNDELKAELEEAWSMAQDMAQEMDDLDNFDLEFSDEDDDADADADALEAEIYNDMDRMSTTMHSVNNAELLEITGKAVATKALLTTVPGGQKSSDRTSRVFAARKRSSRTSKASLRIPKTPTGEKGERPDRSSIYSIHSRRSRSKSVRRRSGRHEATTPAEVQVPEVPVIHIPNPTPKKDGSFLELSETRPVTPAASTASEPPPLPPPVHEFVQASLHERAATSPSEDVSPSTPSVSNPPPSPTFGNVSIPTIELHEEPKAQSSSPWRPRNIFTRRVQSLQPPLRTMDDSTPPLKRSISEVKQFDGWPFLGTHKTQRFSVPVLSAIHPHKSRSSSDSAPAASSSRPSSSSTR